MNRRKGNGDNYVHPNGGSGAPPPPPAARRTTRIRTKLLVTFSLLIALFLSSMTLINMFGIPLTQMDGSWGARKTETFATLDLLADIKKDRLLTYVAERRADLELLGNSQAFRENVGRLSAMVRSGSTDDLDRSPARASVLDRFNDLRHVHGLARVFLVEASTGQVLASTDDKLYGQNQAHQAYFQAALRTAGEMVHDVARIHDHAPPLFLGTRRIDDAVGAPLAVLVLEVDTNAVFKRLLQAGGSLGRTGEVLLVNREGRTLTEIKHPLADGTTAVPFEYIIRAEPAQRAAAGQSGHIAAADYRGEPVMAAYRHVRISPEFGWGMVVKSDTAELFALFQANLVRSFIAVLIGIIAVTLAAWVLVRSFTAPLSALTRASQRFANGDWSVRSGVDRNDEIGVLSNAFDQMADAMEHAFSALTQRTQELQETTRDLTHHRLVHEGALAVSRALSSVVEPEALARHLLEEIMRRTESQIGAIYLSDGDGDSAPLRLLHSAGVPANTPLPSPLTPGEGHIGLAAQRNRVEVLSDIPDSTEFVIHSVAGKTRPQGIAAIPLSRGDRVTGVIALASIQAYRPEHLEMLEMTRVQVATALENAVNSDRTTRMAEELRNANEELTLSNDELIRQSRELEVQSDQLRELARRLDTKREELERADQLKSEFLSNMSHELRTPLNSVLALSQLMLSRGTGTNPEQEAEYLRVMERNGKQLLSLINDILDLAKIEAGRLDLDVGPVAVQSLVTTVVETTRPLAGAKELELAGEVTRDGWVSTDEYRVRQILLNLLSNAVKFTAAGRVRLEAGVDDFGAYFAVSDTGIGIAADKLEEIFGEFRQADGSITRRYRGTGLGLSISRKLAHMLGGTLEVESTPGEGSTFTLRLPQRASEPGHARPGRAEAAVEPQETDAPAPPKERPRVLVVEDDDIQAAQLDSSFSEAGFEVTRASRGDEALAMLREAPPECVVLDLMMPGVDGFEVLERMRSEPATKQTPVLVLSAKELTGGERRRLQANRARPFVQKGSINRDELLALLRKLTGMTPPLPAFHSAGTPPRGTPTPAIARPAPAQRPRILVVEDDPDNRLIITAVLEDIACEVFTAENGHTAIEQAHALAPDLILMDIHLPDMSGLDVTQRLKSDPALTEVPVVALTASAMKGDRERFMSQGCDDYLSKPIDMKAVKRVLRKWLA